MSTLDTVEATTAEDPSRRENEQLVRVRDLETTALDMIAEHRPENEMLLQICRLVEGSLDGAIAIVVRRRSDADLDLISLDELPLELHDAIVEQTRELFGRMEHHVAAPDHVAFADPLADDSRSVWCLATSGLSDRPIAALCVDLDGSGPSALDVDALRRAIRFVQIVVEQADAGHHIAAMIAAEREVVANQLHDDPIQSITVLSLLLQRLARDVPADRRDAVIGARAHADHAIERMRHILFELHPATLDEDGLSTAIEVYLEESLEPLGITWHLDDRMEMAPEPSTAILAFRLAHEALANIAHHAEATAVSITLDEDDGMLTIRIEDDGTGFDPGRIPSHRPGHLGLPNARYLARRSAGRFDITSSPGAGCTVDIRLPSNQRLHAATGGDGR